MRSIIILSATLAVSLGATTALWFNTVQPFDLIEYSSDGHVYVQDYGLTLDDCITAANQLNMSTLDSSYLCEQPR